jgi:thiol-disulfide isomerase/thioredoxin
MQPRSRALFTLGLLATSVSFAAFLSAAETATTTPAAQPKKPLSKEDYNALRTLFRDAHQQGTSGEYAASNGLYQKVLNRLPEAGRFDPNRKQIYYSMAGNHALLGEKEKALDKLQRAVDAGYWNDKVLTFDSNFKTLREDKRYQKIVDESRVGLIKMALSHKDVDGNVLKMENYRDKVIVFDLWGTWCGPCRREIPTLVEMQKKYGKDGLRIIGLTCERGKVTEATRSKVQAFANRNGITYPLVLLDQEEQRAVDLRSLPTKIYIGKNFTPRERESGALPAYRIESKIVPLLKEQIQAD